MELDLGNYFKAIKRFVYERVLYRGSQRQVRGGSPRPDDPSTIQGVLEMGLKKLNPINDVGVTMASR